MKSSSPSWQSTLVALATILLVGGIFIVVFEKSGTDDAIKVWGALGALVGVIVGAVPAYFFGQQGTQAAREEAQRTHDTAISEIKRWQDSQERAQDIASQALRTKQESIEKVKIVEASEKAKAKAAEERAKNADSMLQALLTVAGEEKAKAARALRPELPW